MIQVIDCSAATASAISQARVRTVLGAAASGTRVEVSLCAIDPNTTLRFPPRGETQVAYLLDGSDAVVRHTTQGEVVSHAARRRMGIYLEPGEEATVEAHEAPLSVLSVAVPKYSAKPARSPSPAGYFFEEAELRSLVDEKGIRERTFWVNTETGLSDSWDLQLGRMRYAPRGYSPRHVHRAAPTADVSPEHFYLIESGNGTVAYDGGTLEVGPGNIALIPADEWHQLVASETGLDYIEFQAPFDFVTTMDHDPLGKNWYIKGTDDGAGKPQLWVQS